MTGHTDLVTCHTVNLVMKGHIGDQEMCHTGDLVTCVGHTNVFVTTHYSEMHHTGDLVACVSHTNVFVTTHHSEMRHTGDLLSLIHI